MNDQSFNNDPASIVLGVDGRLGVPHVFSTMIAPGTFYTTSVEAAAPVCLGRCVPGRLIGLLSQD